MFVKNRVIVFLGTCLLSISAHANIFEDITPILLSKYIETKEIEQQDHSINLNEITSAPSNQNKNIIEEVDLNLQLLSEEEIIKTYVTLLPHLTQSSTAQKGICSIKDAEKLNIIAGTTSNQNHNLRSIFPTQTSVGEVCKTMTLATPTSDREVLEERQQQIRFLVENPKLLEKIKKQLDIIAKNEEIFLNYFKVFSSVEQEALNAYFFKSNFFKPINNSRVSLDSFYLMTRSLTLIGLVPAQVWFQLNIEILRTYYEKGSVAQILKHIPEIIANTCKNGIKATIHQHNPYTNAYKRVDNEFTDTFDLARTGKEFFSWGDTALQHEYEFTEGKNPRNIVKKVGIKTLSKITGVIATAYIDAITAQNVYHVIQENKRFASILKNFHTKLHAAAKIIHAYNKIQKLTADTPLRYNQAIEKLLFTNDNELENLVQTLQHDHWINKNFSFVSDWGQILATNHKLELYKAQLAQPLYEVGLLDTITAAASVIEETKKNNMPICFTTYENSQNPTLAATQFWNPLVTTHNAVKNSIELLPEKTRNLLFTGPNGSGKSTNTKGIIFNIILSQTFGLAFAEDFRLAPYTRFITAFNEQEDVAKNLSSFMAEKLQIDTLTKTIANLSADERIFVFMDEAVKGTIEEAAGEIILDTCLKLAQQKQVNALVITHTQAPIQAEELTNGVFKNYFVEVLQPNEQEFVRTFILKEGPAQWWFASPETRKAFIAFLSNEEEMQNTASAE